MRSDYYNDRFLRTALIATAYRLKDTVPDFDDSQFEGDDIAFPHLRWMMQTCIDNIDAYPTDKLSRWIGYVQGVLICKGVTTTNDERNCSRALFHTAYESMGISIPPTIERPINNA